MNLKQKNVIKEEIDKLPLVGRIYPIKQHDKIALIFIAKKKNNKLTICMYYIKLNNMTRKEPFLTPFK